MRFVTGLRSCGGLTGPLVAHRECVWEGGYLKYACTPHTCAVFKRSQIGFRMRQKRPSLNFWLMKASCGGGAPMRFRLHPFVIIAVFLETRLLPSRFNG